MTGFYGNKGQGLVVVVPAAYRGDADRNDAAYSAPDRRGRKQLATEVEADKYRASRASTMLNVDGQPA